MRKKMPTTPTTNRRSREALRTRAFRTRLSQRHQRVARAVKLLPEVLTLLRAAVHAAGRITNHVQNLQLRVSKRMLNLTNEESSDVARTMWICLRCIPGRRKSKPFGNNDQSAARPLYIPNSARNSSKSSFYQSNFTHVLSPRKCQSYSSPNRGKVSRNKPLRATLPSRTSGLSGKQQTHSRENPLKSELSRIVDYIEASKEVLGKSKVEARQRMHQSSGVDRSNEGISQTEVPETPEPSPDPSQAKANDHRGVVGFEEKRTPIQQTSSGTGASTTDRGETPAHFAQAPAHRTAPVAYCWDHIVERDRLQGVLHHGHSDGCAVILAGISISTARPAAAIEREGPQHFSDRPAGKGSSQSKSPVRGYTEAACAATDGVRQLGPEPPRVSVPSPSETVAKKPLAISERRKSNNAGPFEKKRYTMKERVAIALLAANGGPLSAYQVKNYVAERFPQFRKGTGIWESAICAILSSEFRRVTAEYNGFHMYTFVNAAARKRYEDMVSGTLGLSSFSSEASSRDISSFLEVVPCSSCTSEEAQVTEASSEQSPLHISCLESSHQTKPQVSHKNPADETESPEQTRSGRHNIGGVFNRCEYADRSLPDQDSEPLEVVREPDFYKAFPQYLKPSIETMSETDIAKKIEEIKKRPSRKERWGQHLAFVRKTGRNVHDETEGAWNPRSPEKPLEQPLPHTEKSFQRFRDIFNMPKNPIPMLFDGHALAFRDGTLVNMNKHFMKSRVDNF